MNPFKPAVYKFERRKTLSFHKNNICGIDLIDYSKDKKHPGYIIVFLDYYTRFVRLAVSNSKKKVEVDNLLERILGSAASAKDKPDMIHSDQEPALKASKYLKDNNIILYHTEFMGSPMTERVIRSLKEIIAELIYYNRNTTWHDHYEEAKNTYNNREHKVINLTPQYAWTHPESPELLVNRDEDTYKGNKKPRYQVGDTVVTVKDKKRFEKGYTIRWNTKPMTIINVKKYNVYVYTLDDGKNYYQQQLQTL